MVWLSIKGEKQRIESTHNLRLFITKIMLKSFVTNAHSKNQAWVQHVEDYTPGHIKHGEPLRGSLTLMLNELTRSRLGAMGIWDKDDWLRQAQLWGICLQLLHHRRWYPSQVGSYRHLQQTTAVHCQGYFSWCGYNVHEDEAYLEFYLSYCSVRS